MTCTAKEEQVSDVIPSSSRQERSGLEVEISPTIPWMAEEERKTDELTIVERGRLFSVRSEETTSERELAKSHPFLLQPHSSHLLTEVRVVFVKEGDRQPVSFALSLEILRFKVQVRRRTLR